MGMVLVPVDLSSTATSRRFSWAIPGLIQLHWFHGEGTLPPPPHTQFASVTLKYSIIISIVEARNKLVSCLPEGVLGGALVRSIQYCRASIPKSRAKWVSSVPRWFAAQDERWSTFLNLDGAS